MRCAVKQLGVVSNGTKNLQANDICRLAVAKKICEKMKGNMCKLLEINGGHRTSEFLRSFECNSFATVSVSSSVSSLIS